MGSEQRRGVQRVGVVVLAQHALAVTPSSSTSAWIASAVARHVRGRSLSPRSSASLEARSSATQHISFDDT